MKLPIVSIITCVIMAGSVGAQGSAPASPTNFIATDHPWDGGMEIDLQWTLSADDPQNVAFYRIYRSLIDTEILKEDTDAKKREINSAKSAATGIVFQSAAEQGQDKNAPEVLARVREARKAAALKTAAEVDQTYARRTDGRRYRFMTVAIPGTDQFTMDKLVRGEDYYFRIVAVNHEGLESAATETIASVKPRRQAFDGSRFALFIITFIICGAVIFYIRVARSGRELNVRKIAGLDAVEEAVGRATEMGRSVLFIPGIQDMNDIQTIAGLTVLSRVAKTAAEYDAKVEVPTSRSLVMTTARETVKAAFLAAGRPDAYNQDLIYYVTDEQFGYVAYLSGMMVREKPAACFYMGSFFAESLILAETGNSIGAIQVAGTAQPAQLPFFVAACDYTLIGEEFFAASAYLSGEPEQLGSLKGQDVGKSIVGVVMIIGVILYTVAVMAGIDSPLGAALSDAVRYLKEIVLT